MYYLLFDRIPIRYNSPSIETIPPARFWYLGEVNGFPNNQLWDDYSITLIDPYNDIILGFPILCFILIPPELMTGHPFPLAGEFFWFYGISNIYYRGRSYMITPRDWYLLLRYNWIYYLFFIWYDYLQNWWYIPISPPLTDEILIFGGNSLSYHGPGVYPILPRLW